MFKLILRKLFKNIILEQCCFFGFYAEKNYDYVYSHDCSEYI